MQRSPIFLASKSPRRRELLSGLGYEVCVLADTTAHRGYFPGDEEVLANESPEAYVFRTARESSRKDWNFALDFIRRRNSIVVRSLLPIRSSVWTAKFSVNPRMLKRRCVFSSAFQAGRMRCGPVFGRGRRASAVMQ